jgi:molecular chaperone GrpE
VTTELQYRWFDMADRHKRTTNHPPPDGNADDGAISDLDLGSEKSAKGEVEELRQQLSEAQERALRLQAELENTRKRMRREMDDERRYAELPLLSELLPVIDNITRAIEAAEKNADAASLLAGFKMVGQQLESILERHHGKKIETEGVAFDPAVHQAIVHQPSDQHPENAVILTTQTGYTLHDRVIRPAQVIVSKKPD